MPMPTFTVSPLVLGLLLAVSLSVAGGFGVAFIYHWRAYGMDTRLIRLATPVYCAVTALLAASAIIAYVMLL